jgi:hypothetical protein
VLILRRLKHTTMVADLRASLVRIDFDRAALKSFRNLPVMSHGFSPGGNGLYRGRAATHFPLCGTLILGSNFNIEVANLPNADGML